MEKRILKIQFSKGGSGSISPRISIPKSWIDKLDISEQEREVKVLFDEEKKEIIIKKLGK